MSVPKDPFLRGNYKSGLGAAEQIRINNVRIEEVVEA
jgi:hypothetical protein